MNPKAVFLIRTIPLTLGIFITITSFLFGFEFFDRGLDFDDEEFSIFLILFLIGFPLILVGLNVLGEATMDTKNGKENHD
jgi:hypothetical protein